MNDMIDRMALIEDLREYKVDFESTPSTDEAEIKGYNDGIDMAITVISKFPSAELTAKAFEHDASVIVDGYKYQRSEYLCGNCKKKVLGGDDYCSHCGAKLDWTEL